MKKSEIETFEKVNGQLQGFYQELAVMAKKNPNDAVNKFKLNLLNQLLSDANAFLSKKYRPFEDFDGFRDEELPSNSDVTFIIVQYLNCFEKLRADNITQPSYTNNWYWIADGEKTTIQTGPPRKIK